ncbi:beta strand repeat-containing protein [Clostridium sp. C105KSO13]|uniref:beta strand repeat-containing protein n=1 Tax=Clostridium sp. C105KSO13 TaxID=1776045 RepID=UPI000740618E|nr:hypothetical protein [Clostridium sp. C105KSO13]CUX28394.1 putative outer membrane protein PmpB precursor [Clostridium sp. C105KSO13]
MVKGWKYILSMILVITLVTAGPLTVVHAEDPNADAAVTNENQPNLSKLSNIMEAEEPYQAFGQRKDRSDILDKLSEKEIYELMILMRYQYLKEDIQGQDQSLKAYQDIVENWKKKVALNKNTDAIDKDIKGKYSEWNQEAFSFLPDKSIVYERDNVEKKVTDFVTYAEYLQTLTAVDVSQFLKLLEVISDADSSEMYTEAVKDYENFRNEAYGFDDAETIETEQPNIDKPDMDGRESSEDSDSSAGGVPESEIQEKNQTEINDSETTKGTLEKSITARTTTHISILAATNVARIGSTYYTSFDAAFAALPSGGTLYVLKSTTIGHNVNTKSFTIMPEGANVVLTADSSVSSDAAGAIATPSGASSTATWNFSGNGGYTLTIDGAGKYGSGILSSGSSITINLKSGVRLRNASTNGVWNAKGTTNLYDNAIIYNSSYTGIASQGTVNVYGGEIYGSAQQGVRADKITMSGGAIHDNGAAGIQTQSVDDNTNISVSGGNIYNNGSDGLLGYAANNVCTIDVSGGTIYSNGSSGIRIPVTSGTLKISGSININKNAVGVVTASTTSMSGGSINANKGSGVNTSKSFSMTGGNIYSNTTSGNGGGIYNAGTLTLSGGTVYSNTATGGGGVYNSGTLTLSGATIKTNNASTGAGIQNTGTLTVSSGTLSGNTSSGHGGGIYNTNALNISGGYVNSNTSKVNGGGVYLAGGKLNMSGGYIQNNTASNYGGGICVAAGTISQLNDGNITGNTAINYGGGLFTNVNAPLNNNTITGNKAVNNGGGGIYINYTTLTLAGNNISSNTAGDSGGGICGYQATINHNSGTMNSNKAGVNGGAIFSGSATNVNVKGGTLSNNEATSNNGGAIYIQDGVGTMSSGTITGNKAVNDCGGGIFIDNGSTLNLKGGTLSSNSSKWGGGVFNQYGGVVTMTGGTVSGNSASDRGGGLFNKSSGATKGIMNLTGGTISANTSTNTGSGIAVQSTINVGGAVNIKNDNNVALFDGNYLNIISALTGSTPIMIVPNSYANGSKIASVAYGTKLGSLMFSRFVLVNDNGFVIRPGNYQTGAGTNPQDITVSSKYTIIYNKNTSETVGNVPESGTKFWYENYTISSAAPSWLYGRFKGWNETSTANTGAYLISGTIKSDINRNIMLYAIWDSTLQIKYDGNQAESGTNKADSITFEATKASGGYIIKGNTGYTDWSRNNFKLMGWSTNPLTVPGNVEYPEGTINKLSYETLYGIALKQGITEPNSPYVTLYAIWDKHPVIKTEDKEVFEGETITREDLLKDIHAQDQEDGDLTSKIKIVKISYAAGKLVEGEKQESYIQSWDQGMPEDQTLDTWFLQLDEEGGSAIHKITYQVTDSAGNVVTKDSKITVKYNHFPTIEAEDRYYTLEEAQTGAITEDELLKNAIAENKVYGEDAEDGKMSDKIKLIDFHPEDLAAFTDSGYVSVTYHVQDSMGPEKKGKETTKQIKVNIIKDGEKTETSPVQIKYIRFINKDNYYKNADANVDDLSQAEKKEKNANGGLCVDSRWYSNSAYRGLITSLWENPNSKEVWKFTPDDVVAVKRYIEDYGIGNSKSQTALNEFVSRFQEVKY